MKYMVQLFGNRETWDADMAGYTPDTMRAMHAHMTGLNDELVKNGEFVQAEGLGGPGGVKSVRARTGGAPEVTDGPHFPAEKILAGYWVIDVKDEARAIAFAAQVSASPGPDGAPTNEPVEIHAVPSGPPEA
ncbi:YciI family protein [Streptomyces sp. NPDC050509]|uniref:YciI family protein n=1 Tax=Streptomyces sp. NPDC050509 TaxID=3365620 RepID=UPI0037B9B149